MYVNRCFYELCVFMLSLLFSETAANAFADLKAMNSAVMAEYTKVCMYDVFVMTLIYFYVRRSEWMMYVCVQAV